jgi:GntR family transcriptional regulator
MSIGVLDKNLAIPLYHQLQNILKAEIEAGRLAPDARLPSEQELATRFGVSKITVRQALTELAQAGYIRREQGRGTFVSGRTFDEGPRELNSFTEEMRRHQLKGTSRILAQFLGEAEIRVADALGLRPNSQVCTIKRLRLANGEPMSVQTAYLPPTLVPDLRLTEGMSLYETVQSQYHLYPARARETYLAALADRASSELLEITEGSPVFRVERVTFTASEQPFEFVQSTVRGDRYAIILDLVKNAGEQQALKLNPVLEK